MEDQVKTAYEHLEKLYEQLPMMEAKNQKLLAGENARKVLDADKRRRLLREEYSRYEKQLQDAVERQDLGFERVTAELLSVRTAPLKQAEKALADALKEGAFETAEAAEKALLKDDERELLIREIEEFKKAYDEALQNCQALEALLGED